MCTTDVSTITLVGFFGYNRSMAEKKAKSPAKTKKAMSPKGATQLETLLEMSTAVVSDRYIEEILQLMVRMTADMMGSKVCSIMMLDESGRKLEIRATQALSEDYKSKPPLEVGQSISGLAVIEKRPITALDVTKEPLYMYPEIAKDAGLRSMISVPMMIKDRVIGVLNSYKTNEYQFTPGDIKVLQIIANQAAIAIENTKLFDKAAAMEEELRVKKVIDKAKGIIIRQHGISEDEALKIMQRQSMNKRMSMAAIAEAIILTNEIKP